MVVLGSSYSLLKSAITSRFQQRAGLQGVAVSYQAPLQADDVTGSAGSYESIWLDDTDGEYENRVICALPLQLEETYSVRLVVQVLAPESEGTQEVADRRVDELLYEVMSELAYDPTFGLSGTGNIVYLHATHGPFRRITGLLPNGMGHGARFEMNLEVDSRLEFHSTG